METKNQGYFLGIDLNDRYAMISCYKQNMKEPETISTIAGGDRYQIPTLFFRAFIKIFCLANKSLSL